MKEGKELGNLTQNSKTENQQSLMKDTNNFVNFKLWLIKNMNLCPLVKTRTNLSIKICAD